MNVFRSRLLAVATIGFGAALGFTATVGQAQEVPVLSDVLALQGTAGIDATSSGLLGCSGFVCIVGGHGSYHFNSTVCEAASVGDPSPVAACAVGSTGIFQNLVCGTGSAEGSATITGEPEGTETATYIINFVGGVGVLTGELPEADGEAGDYLVGVVDLGPEAGTTGAPQLNECVDGFSITAVLAGIENSPVAPPVVPAIAPVICGLAGDPLDC